MAGRNPLVRLHPIERGLFTRSLTPFFQVSESEQLIMPWLRIFCSRSSVRFVFFHFNIPRMFKLVFLQVVALLRARELTGVVHAVMHAC